MMAYSAFCQLIGSTAFRAGVEVIGRNPAYTSVIGQAKFESGYKLTPHEAAAVAIARRGLDLGSAHHAKAKIHLLPTCKESTEACLVGWRVVSRMLSVSASPAPVAASKGLARGIPLSIATGPSPAMDGSPGPEETPLAEVSTTVRLAYVV